MAETEKLQDEVIAATFEALKRELKKEPLNAERVAALSGLLNALTVSQQALLSQGF